jgi:hypothetical protein
VSLAALSLWVAAAAAAPTSPGTNISNITRVEFTAGGVSPTERSNRKTFLSAPVPHHGARRDAEAVAHPLLPRPLGTYASRPCDAETGVRVGFPRNVVAGTQTRLKHDIANPLHERALTNSWDALLSLLFRRASAPRVATMSANNPNVGVTRHALFCCRARGARCSRWRPAGRPRRDS